MDPFDYDIIEIITIQKIIMADVMYHQDSLPDFYDERMFHWQVLTFYGLSMGKDLNTLKYNLDHFDKLLNEIPFEDTDYFFVYSGLKSTRNKIRRECNGIHGI